MNTATSSCSAANFCLTVLHKSDRFAAWRRREAPSRSSPQLSASPAAVSELRAGIVGTGFIGRVHARSARLAGARLAGVAASSPESAREAAGEIGAERAFASAEELVVSDEIDVVHVCAPNHLHLPLARAALEAGKHVVCEKPIALDVAGAAELVAAAERAGRVATVPFVYRYYPTVREARARARAGRARRAAAAPRRLPPGLAARRHRRQLAGRARARRPLARLRRHRLALVRPDRVRLRPADRVAQRAHRRSPTPSAPRREARSFERGDGDGAPRAVETEDIAAVMFETDAGIVGSTVISQVSAGRKNQLWFEARRHRGGRRLRPGAARDALGRAALGRRADPARLRHPERRGGRLRDPARRPPAGLPRTASTRSSPRPTPRSRASPAPTGCRRSPTACGPSRITEAVLESAREPRLGGGGEREARPAQRLHARARRSRRSPPGPASTATRRSSSPPGRGSATARSSPATSPPTSSTRPRPSACARRSTTTALELSALAYYDNNLHPDPAQREAIHAHLRACIDAAAALGGVPVGTFIGRDNSLSVADNLREAERVLPPLVEYAGERGVRLMIENCVMEGWHPDGYPGNLAYSPELWEWMFELGFWLNFDPSHLLWIGIDPVAALRPYVDRVIHAHAKDAETFPAERNRYGFFGRIVDPRVRPLGHGLVAVPHPRPRRGRLAPLRRHPLRGRLRRRALGRARGPGLGRHAGEGRGRARARRSETCDRWWSADDGRRRPRRRRCSRSAAWSRSTRACAPCRASTSTCSRARSIACSAPTAPASRP